MKLTAEEIQNNWIDLEETIKSYISEPRRSQLLDFYSQYAERIMMMPASYKKEYHNAFPGGYVDHILRVVDCDLKLGDEEHESYVPQTDQWRKDKLGEDYTFNTKLAFASVPDRGLYLLQQHGIKYSFNEMITIQTHDGLYDEGNKKYLMAWTPEQRPRTSLPFIVHQADLMASRIEFEREWLPKFKTNTPKNFKLDTPSTTPTEKKIPIKTKALGSIQSENLKNMLNNL